MSITSVHTDYDRLSVTMVADFPASVEQVWELWSDPRKLERWWGPPTYPATVEQHDLTPGGSVTYFMTGPEGDRHRGWWRIEAVDPPASLEFVDGFADDTGAPNPDLPTMNVQVSLSELGDGRTQMVVTSTFSSIEHMEQLERMGMVEGLTAAINQIDALVAA